MNRAWASFFVTGLFSWAVACSSDGHPAATNDVVPPPSPTPTPSATNVASTPDSGGSGDAAVDPLACAPEPVPASLPTFACNSSAAWGSPTRLPISSTYPDYLIGVTPDEHTIVYFQTWGLGPRFFVSDRNAATDPFGTPLQIDVSQAGGSRFSLEPDGLGLVVTAADMHSFSEIRRSGQGVATFGAPTEGPFSLVNAAVAPKPDETLADPVFSGDNLTMVYTRFVGTEADTIWTSTRAAVTDPWPVGTKVSVCELQAHDGKRRVPTALSADGRTLYYIDEPRGITRAAWRPAVDAPFFRFGTAPATLAAVPNGTCSRLYYSVTTAGSDIDLVVAASQ